MAKQISRIHQRKTPIRRHYIEEWMEARNMTVEDVVEEIGVDRSTVYRWINKGQLPQPAWQEKLGALFRIDPEELTRHPDEDWLSRFFKGRSDEEKDRIKQAMELAWPPRTGTE